MFKIILTILLFVTVNCNAQIIVNSDNFKIKNKIINIINDYKISNFKINKINININITKKNSKESYADVNNNECNIILNYNKRFKPVLIQNFNADLEFTFLHEIGHCVLGKEALYNKIDWVIEIKDMDKSKIETLINKNENNYLSNKKNIPVMLVYYEIFADTFASLNYLKKEYRLKDIVELKNFRFLNYQKFSGVEPHYSFSALEDIMLIKPNILQKLSDKELLYLTKKITQEKIIEFLIIN